MRGGSRRPEPRGVERGPGREREREREQTQPRGGQESGAQSQAKPGQMALQPSGTAPVQPGPTLAVQTFLYPNKTIKPSSMKRSLHDCVGNEQPETTTHITGVLKGTRGEPWGQLSDNQAMAGQSVHRKPSDPYWSGDLLTFPQWSPAPLQSRSSAWPSENCPKHSSKSSSPRIPH